MKKIYLILGILFLGTIAMAYLYFSTLNTDKNANDLSLQAITRNCAIVFSFDNDKSFYEILSGQDLLQNLLGETKSKQLKNLRDEIIENSSVFNILEGQKTFIGISAGNDAINFVIATQLKTSIMPGNLISTLDSKTIKIKQSGPAYELTFADSTQVFIGFKDKMVLLSNSLSEINSLLKQQQLQAPFATYIKENSRFNRNSLANLFLNFNHMPSLLRNILNNKLTGELSIFNKQNAFAAFNYNFSKEKLLFTGNTIVNEQQNYFSLFKNLPAQKLAITNILPRNTANFTIYAINDYLVWQKELNKWLELIKENEKINGKMQEINEKYRLDLQQVLPKYLKNQFVTFQLNTGEKFGAIALSNGEKLNQFLLDLSTEYDLDVRIFKETGLPFSFYGEPFRKFDRPFYTIIDNYLIMANNASSIQAFLNSYRTNKLLINDDEYISFNNQLSSSATISFYVNNKNSNDIFGRNLKMPYYKQYQAESGLKNYNAFCYQLSGDKDKFLTNLLIFKKVGENNESDTLKINQ